MEWAKLKFHSETVRAMFDPVTKELVDLIKEQTRRVQLKMLAVKESDPMRRQIKVSRQKFRWEWATYRVDEHRLMCIY